MTTRLRPRLAAALAMVALVGAPLPARATGEVVLLTGAIDFPSWPCDSSFCWSNSAQTTGTLATYSSYWSDAQIFTGSLTYVASSALCPGFWSATGTLSTPTATASVDMFAIPASVSVTIRFTSGPFTGGTANWIGAWAATPRLPRAVPETCPYDHVVVQFAVPFVLS